ncbi:hypothetical protein [uncultured Methanobrevibacter sp.]|jgi:hypothetical protein|uniref:hypothetical protein n=1 Tax=uncultured Methanobrevibacter sp. TaxID=253161 RepID=UPI0025DE5AD0|nr:hypothetical protein [uncultured Methanobrevibacter sp.]MEE1133652.1 hypothetical protein [Methanobrevibacter sp.]MEE3489289.1 hypothetical protein [Methanobrevibacter sp.]
MDNTIFILMTAIDFVVAIIVFTILCKVLKFASNKLKASERFNSFRLFHLEEYFPEEQATEIRQIYYLTMIVLFVLNFLYLIVYWRDVTFTLVVFDILLSAYLAIGINKSSGKTKWLLLFLLVPFNSIAMVIFSGSFVYPLDICHSLAFLYFIKVYYDKFINYTETNSLGITIMLLFIIVFVSFIFTAFVEDVSPLDALVMASNAFTSNGYAVLGNSSVGKLNSLILVWSGFILSGVATATLTVAIVMKRVNNDFDRLEELVKKNKKN